MNDNDKNIKQMLNICDTVLEAISYTAKLVRENKYNEVIFLYSTVVDGLMSIEEGLKNDKKFQPMLETMDSINQSILLIAKMIEQNNMMKVLEVIQFSLSPQLHKLVQQLEAQQTNTNTDKPLLIGVYYCPNSPLEAMPDLRAKALVKAAEQQNAKIFFFSSVDVQFADQTINGDILLSEKWVKERVPFPDVIHNIGVSAFNTQSDTEIKLKKEIPFTSFGVGNKIHLPNKLLQSKQYADFLVPFKLVTNDRIVYDFMTKYEKVVIKPVDGRRGESIYFVEQNGQRYIVKEHKKKVILDFDSFNNFLQKIILVKNKHYMIQPYINCRTKQGSPYDIRAHVQKNGEGKWQLTKIYPRMGHKNSILSNISRGGKTEGLSSFLKKEFNHLAEQIENELCELSLDIAQHIDRLYGSALDELGLDLAIDNNNKIWMHEVNGGPQSTYHEDERAENTIAYAIYLAENGLYFSNEFEKYISDKNQFDSQKTSIDRFEDNGKLNIGMLTGNEFSEELAVACAYVAKYEDVNYYYFSPQDIDYKHRKIRGYFYEDNKWVPKVVDYPDAIYDRLRARGMKGTGVVYSEFEGIPFTNERYGNSMSKIEVYDNFKQIDHTFSFLIPYERVNHTDIIYDYLNKYNKIILKPSVGSYGQSVIYIEMRHDHSYFVVEKEKEEYLSEENFDEFIQNLIPKTQFVVQKYIETRTIDGNPFDVRVKIMKDGTGEWSITKVYGRIGIDFAIITPSSRGGYTAYWPTFAKRNFGEEKFCELDKNLRETSLNIAQLFEGFGSDKISEIALDIAISKELELFLIEVNVNRPGILNHEFDVAKHAIPYAAFLSRQ